MILISCPPQGSILGPLLFLVFLNDLPTIVTNCTINLYADDTTIYYANRDPDNVTRAINTDLQVIATWIESNKMTMNVSKTRVMVLSRRAARSWAELINVQINGTPIPKQKSIKYLGMTIDNDLSWKTHIGNVRRRMLAAIASIRRLSPYLLPSTKRMLYNALVLPYTDYCSVVWIPAAPASAKVLSEYKTSCELSYPSPHAHLVPPSETSSDGPLSTIGTTSQCYARSIDVCSNKLPVIYQESLLRTHVPIHPIGEPTNSTFRNHVRRHTGQPLNSKVLWNTIDSHRVFDVHQLYNLSSMQCSIYNYINHLNSLLFTC